MIDKFYTFEGNEPGPTSVILGGVHGNEICGVEAVEQTIQDVALQAGRLIIGIANPKAIELNVRQVEANLNRMFADPAHLSETDLRSYEFDRAQEIRPLLDSASALLDIHASFTPGARPFAICEPNALGVADRLPVDLLVSGFDEVEPGGTDYYMNSIGAVGICVECGYLGDKNTTEVALDSIRSFLVTRGHIEGRQHPVTAQEYIRMTSLYRTITDFTLAKPFGDFEELSDGQLIGTDGELEVRSEGENVIVFARDRPAAEEEAFLLGSYTPSLV